MKVLDLGSGAGDVALLLADLVGPQGKVVGIDVNDDIVDTARSRVSAAGWTNVEFVVGDLNDLDLATDFDAVVGRWILMYLAEPADLLRRIQAHVRPGAVIAFQESANLAAAVEAFPPTPLHDVIARWTTPPGNGNGPIVDMGRRLHSTFLDAGLPAPQLRLDAPIGGGADWPGYAYVAASIRSLFPVLEQRGMVTADEADLDTLADRLRAEVVEGNGVQILPTVIGASARS
jgi:SAM-dependent methyltransferase